MKKASDSPKIQVDHVCVKSLNDLLLNRLTPCAAVAQVCRRQNSASVCRCICRACVCAGCCIRRAECPERLLSLLAALTFMEDVACSLYLIWFFTPFRFIVVLKLCHLCCSCLFPCPSPARTCEFLRERLFAVHGAC